MTRVCLVGTEDVVLKYELLSRETAREALSTYDLAEPFENAIALETVSVGAAVALLNDLNWYLVRFVDAALVREPSISDEEWLSRELAEAVRNDRIAPEETDRYLKIYGVETTDDRRADANSESRPTEATAPDDAGDAGGGSTAVGGRAPDGGRGDAPPDPGEPTRRLVEPLYVRRTGDELPEYDLRDVDETVVVRVTESEFGA